MILLISGEYHSHNKVRLLQIDEETATTSVVTIDTKSAEDLIQLKKVLDEGVSFADFQILESTVEGKTLMEFQHLTSNQIFGDPINKEIEITPLESLTGFIRLLIINNGLIVLPSRKETPLELESWMTVNPNTVQISDDLSMSFSHLVPSHNEEGKWRWASTPLVQGTLEDKFTDYSHVIFLVPQNVDLGDYEGLLDELEPRVVKYENGDSDTYRALKFTEAIEPYDITSNIITTPPVIARLKFVADAYKLALYSLTVGLFKEKPMEEFVHDYGSTGERIHGRKVILTPNVKPTKKVAEKMMQVLMDSLTAEITEADYKQFKKEYPQYHVYESIIRENFNTFYGDDIPYHKKMSVYRQLKNVETLANLLLADLRYTTIYENNGDKFEMWIKPDAFKTDIPNYTIQLGGGGGQWRPKSIFLF